MRLSRRKMILIFSNNESFTKTAPIHDNIVEVFIFVLEIRMLFLYSGNY